ncbi:MAG: metalloregulator ArsR/SmtB family transcription factor [Spirochaetia bacterium]|uniref:ArsR/SmtB family transcription factor n=1 Tax=Treponema berlinense TaxID=225004 RepID=UPI0026E9C57F|nr:metalloregulator ArsR/SmtB family transcription factor [Treponema berlinense]MDD5790594.1 metalloregulator ArsR/SmtB family transcription factor [Spirochaetia bacterium]
MLNFNETEFHQKLDQIRSQFKTCTPYMTTLSDPVRQKILLILAESGTDGMDVQDITSKTHLSRPAISHHLRILKDAGMIISHKKGTQVYYFLYIQKALDQMMQLLNTVSHLVENIDMESIKEKAPWMLDSEYF